MKWPEKPTCHGESPRFASSEVHWRDQEMERRDDSTPYTYPFRTCSYCGSIHPEDLLRLLDANIGIKLGGSDWKYGWPHKFYVEGIPNPSKGVKVAQYGYGGTLESWQKDYPEAKSVEGDPKKFLLHYFDAPASTHAKWYNEHIMDEMDEEARAILCAKLAGYAGVAFNLKEGRLCYSAPYRGYQR